MEGHRCKPQVSIEKGRPLFGWKAFFFIQTLLKTVEKKVIDGPEQHRY
jgi:hypothetical protein